MENVERAGQPAAAICRDVEREFGRRMRTLRKSLPRRNTQEAVVSRMRQAGHDWHQTTLSKVEAGQRGVSLNEAYCLALILGAHLSDFLDEAPGELQREMDRATARFFEAHEAMTEMTRRFQAAERSLDEVTRRLGESDTETEGTGD